MRRILSDIAPWLIYPALMAACISVHQMLVNEGVALVWANYGPVIGAALIITFLEWALPQRVSWHPTGRDIRTDATFMVAIQIALPYLVSAGFVLWLLETGDRANTPLHGLWPHGWPIAVQAVLMIFSADFLRYWLHRAAHEVPLLWRLHAVHHSPPRLYWFNVGRFHPFDKLLQLFLDTLPFILVGVDATVASLYFVFYAINGFFQHCNIQLRFGVLNYFISSAELHRWHHSRLPEESNRNYGNNVIVWDWVFGTRFLPGDREVGDLGLTNREYPASFDAQMRAPFTAKLDKLDLPLPTWREIVRRPFVALTMRYHHWQYMRRVRPMTQSPRQAQERVLRSILATNAGTRFGVAHHFEQIRDVNDYRANVPVQTFDSLRPWIEEQMNGLPALTTQTPIMYARTSGTTAGPKLLPLVATSLEQYREEQRALCAIQYQLCPEAFHGKSLGMVGPAIEGYAPNGKSFGSVSGYFYAHMPKWMRSLYAVPAEVFSIESYDQKYLVMARHALAEPNISYLAAANPSSFIRLLDVINANCDSLLDELASGNWNATSPDDRPRNTPDRATFKAQPERARKLRALRARRPLTYSDIWPSIRMVTTWSGGSCGIALNALRDKLPSHTIIYDAGYVASEMRGTLSLDGGPFGLPLLYEHFFEFVERDAWESGTPRFLTIDELKPGATYYIFVTTASGLYRYSMDDIVEAGSTFENTPLLRFVQKGAGVTSITGEKLYEAQLIAAISGLEQQYKFDSAYYTCVADEVTATYTLYLEPEGTPQLDASQLAQDFDRMLAHLNIEYEAKRASGRLAPANVIFVRSGTGEVVKRNALSGAKRESQYKPRLLQYRRDVDASLIENFTTLPPP